MQITLQRVVPGVAPEAALAWWSDFHDGRHDHPTVPGQRRRVETSGDGAFAMEDEVRWLGVPVFRERTTARRVQDGVVFEGVNGFARFRGSYMFAAVEGGTQVTLAAQVELRGALRWTDRLARPIVERILRADLAMHAREMARDLSGQRG